MFLFLLTLTFLIGNLSASLGIDNPTLPRLIRDEPTIFLNQSINQTIINNFNQSLNTTDNVQFNNVTLTGWFNGLFNWTSISSFLSFDGANLDFNETLLNLTIDQKTQSITYNASLIINESGVVDAGNISSIQVAKDGNTYNVSEVTGASPLTIIVNFTGVIDFNSMIIREWYQGGQGHEIIIGLFDYTTGDYEEEYGDITDMDGFAFQVISVIDATDHISGGNVSLRFRHDQNGNPAHNFFIDYIVLVDGFTTITTSEHDALTGRDDCSNNHPDVLCVNGSIRNASSIFVTNNVTADFFFGDGSQLTGITGLWTQNTTAGTTWLTNTSMNVGIGTTSPASKFEIKGSSAAESLINVINRNGNIVFEANTFSDYGYLRIRNASANTKVLFSAVGDSYFDAGNVGIGTTSPARLLHLNGGGSNSQVIQFTNTATGTTSTDGTSVGVAGTNDFQIYNWENGYLRFGTNNVERMRILANGNVGIGTVSPDDPLDVTTSEATYVAHFNSDASSGSNFGVQITAGTTSADIALAVQTASGGFFVRGDGDVGIGTSTPGFPLEVRKAVNGNLVAEFVNTQSGGSRPYGIGILFPNDAPDDNTRYALAFGDSSTTRAIMYSDGDWYNSDGTYGTISDERFKSNVRDTTNQLEKISQIQVRDYLKYDTMDKKGIGKNETNFLAQELELIYPELVSDIIWNNESVKAVKTTDFIPIVIKAIQELKEENDLKDIRINELETENNLMQEDLCFIGITRWCK